MRSPSIVFGTAFLAMFFQAQTSASEAIQGVIATHEAADAEAAAPANNSISAPVAVTTAADEEASGGAAQQSKTPTQTPKANKPKPSSDSDRPPIEGSMVGYIDNAIVGNELRLRFDAGFHDLFPDRAEFFYAQCGCEPGAAGPKPGIADNLNFQQLYMRVEYAPITRLSFFVEVPVRWIQPLHFVPGSVQNAPGFGNQAGISDMQAGIKFAIIASHRQFLTAQLAAEFASGDSTKGLGTGHYSVAPSVLYFQKFTDRFSLEAQLGGDLPTGSSGTLNFAGNIFTYGIGPSYEAYRGEKVKIAPVLELVGWHILGGLETNPALFGIKKPPVQSADGINIVNLKAGVRTSFGNHSSVYAGFGQALTHNVWYKNILRVEYRYTF
jgi:hypothetical protein